MMTAFKGGWAFMFEVTLLMRDMWLQPQRSASSVFVVQRPERSIERFRQCLA